MTISSVGGAAQSYLSQLFSTQKTQTSSSVPVDPATDDGTDTSAADASTSNSLTDSAASLNSQTMQALLDLTQQDRIDASQQASKKAHHHHHGGGSMPLASDAFSTPDQSTTSAFAPNSGANAKGTGAAASSALSGV